MANITHYQVKDLDTLESIASRFLGDPSKWTDIVQANNLRYPFISDDPKYQLGVVLSSGNLGKTLDAGSTTFTIPLDTPRLAVAKSAFYISQVSKTGRHITETLILSADSTIDTMGNVLLTFSAPVENSYDGFAEWSLFSDPILQTSKVVQSGQIIILYNSLSPDTTDTRDEFERLLGVDVSIDEETRQIRWNSVTHDFETVSGVLNLKQALRLKLMTGFGDLLYHARYGNRLLQYIGLGNTATLANLANGLVRECILQDSRIFAVENVTVHVEKDVCSVDCTARVRGLDTLITVTSLGIEL